MFLNPHDSFALYFTGHRIISAYEEKILRKNKRNDSRNDLLELEVVQLRAKVAEMEKKQE